MTEDPERQLRRTVLEKEKVKISQAQQWLAAVLVDNDEDAKVGKSSDTLDVTMEDWSGSV